MKKFFKCMSVILLAISIILVLIIIIPNMITIIRIMFFGITVGSEYPDTIWCGKMTLKGLEGIKYFYKAWDDLVYMFELPVLFISIIYQIIYFKFIRKHK